MRHKWYLHPTRSIAVGAAAKCGSTSIKQMCEDEGCDFYDIPDDRLSIGVVRHPVPRFYSLWAHIQRGYPSPKTRAIYRPYKGKTPSQTFNGLYARIQSGKDDVHTRRQVLLGGLTDCHQLIRTEHLGEYFPEMGHANKNPDPTIMPYNERLYKQICDVYGDDLRLWESAECLY